MAYDTISLLMGPSDFLSPRRVVAASQRPVSIRVSVETRVGWPDIPWQDIAGMRHRLIHAYFDIDLDIVWSTVTEDLQPLAEQLERALATTSG